MMCKPTVLSSGEWILPASTWRDTDNSARVIVSTDKGQTFSLRGACNVPEEVRSFDEHMIVERKDKSLWMLVRTSYGIGESISKDRGKTWSALEPSSIQHPSARFFIRRLNSGNLLLVKHGPISKRTERSHLTAYLSITMVVHGQTDCCLMKEAASHILTVSRDRTEPSISSTIIPEQEPGRS